MDLCAQVLNNSEINTEMSVGLPLLGSLNRGWDELNGSLFGSNSGSSSSSLMTDFAIVKLSTLYAFGAGASIAI